MKMNSIASICKKRKNITLFERRPESGDVQQYISDGFAVYPIVGLLPHDVINETFVEKLSDVAKQTEEAFKKKKSGNTLRSRSPSLHGRRRERRRSSALPVDGCYL